MIRETITPAQARRFYDRLGAGHDLAELYEGPAKALARARLDLAPGQRVANVGAGTGRDHARLLAAVRPGGAAVAVDVSPVMLGLVRARTGAPVLRGDARHLPLRSGAVDRLFCAYVLDLIPAGDLAGTVAELRRVLRPSGRIALVSLTGGTTRVSRAVIAGWTAVYHLNPGLLGGCRPVQLADVVRTAGFADVRRAVVVRWGVPSEVITATR